MKPPPELPIMPLTLSHLAVAAELHAQCFGEEAWTESALHDVMAMPGAFGALSMMRDEADDLRPAAGMAFGLLPGFRTGMVPTGFYIGLLLGQEAELLTLGVAPEHRGHGLGSALVEHFLQNAAKSGAREAFLEVAIDNAPALHLYRRLDFLQVGRRRDYYERPGNTRVSALVLRHLFP